MGRSTLTSPVRIMDGLRPPRRTAVGQSTGRSPPPVVEVGQSPPVPPPVPPPAPSPAGPADFLPSGHRLTFDLAFSPPPAAAVLRPFFGLLEGPGPHAPRFHGWLHQFFPSPGAGPNSSSPVPPLKSILLTHHRPAPKPPNPGLAPR